MLVWLYLSSAGTTHWLAEGDDVMRMVMVRDLLNGEPWQSQGVPRDNTPFGGQMHWSALVGLPLAGLVAILGERLAVIVWPLSLLLPLMLLTLAATRRLAPAAGAGIIAALLALNITIMAEFSPGRIDHHNVQIVLLQAVLVTMLWARHKAWGGVLTGVLLATCLAIGMETLPIVVAAGVAYAWSWLTEPMAHRAGMVGLALGLAGGMAGQLLFATPLPELLVAYCDANSIVYAIAAGLGGLALAIAALGLSGAPIWWRIAGLAVLGAAAVGVTLLLFPACLAGPYGGVTPRMLNEVFPLIPEVQPLWRRVIDSPGTAIPAGAAVLAALAIVLWRAWRERDRRGDWLVLLCLLGAAAVVMLMQIRGARLAVALSLPVGAWVIAALWARYRARPALPRGLALAGGWIGFATWNQALILALVSLAMVPELPASPGPNLDACISDDAYDELAALPPGGVAAPYLLGPYILLNTPHSVVSAGYHRNGASVNDAMDFFSDAVRARAVASERSLSYAVSCGVTGDLDTRSWLTPLTAEGPLRLYRIDK